MKPFRKHVALSVDGGGIKGVMVTKALSMLEEHLGRSVHEIFRLAAGTSTGSIISAGLAAGLSAAEMHELYLELGAEIFERSWRTLLFPLTRYRYPHAPLESALRAHIGELVMGDFWKADPRTDVVITVFDLVANKTRFIKPWKPEYAGWPVTQAVLASSSVPTYFPVVEGRYVDGGVGSYANPSYLAAYEIKFCLGWDLAETTLLSLGTGRSISGLEPERARSLWPWQWLGPVLGAFLHSADDQQVHLVDTFFEELDFRRFQVNLREPIEMDDPGKIPLLVEYGEELGHMILNDELDHILAMQAARCDAEM